MDKSRKTIALIGCGGWGKNLARNLHELGALAIIVDPSPQAEELAASFGVRHSSDSKSALADAAISAVVVASPAATHARVAAEALAAGKDVFVEKPIALRVGEAMELQRLAAAHNRILMVGHLLQYHTGFLKLKEIARSGSLGHIRHMTSSRLNLGLIRSEENVVWSFAPHDISMLLAIAGALPERVSAVGTTVLQEGIPDIATVHMQFAGGLKADVTISWLHPQKEQQLIVVGDDGMAVFADTKPWPEKLRVHRNKVSWAENRPKAAPGPVEAIALEQSEPLKEEMRHFLQCVATREMPRTHVEEAIGVLTVLEAAQASLDSQGAWIETAALVAAAPQREFSMHETAIVDEGCVIGRDTRIWHFAHVLKGSVVGERCVIGQNVMIGPDVSIGNGCKIQNNVAIYKGVTLEDDVFCGPSMVFTNVLTPRAHVERKNEFAPTRIGRGATLGANCTIVCGNNVGEYAMVGAGAVVTRDVPPYALVVGNPARQIGWVSKAGERLGADMVCPRTGERYDFLMAPKVKAV
jgi:predicted dehydrogenase